MTKPQKVPTADLSALEERLAHYSGYGDLSPKEALDLLERARDRCPVAHSDELGGFHMVFNYEDAKRVHLDADTFSSTDGMFRPTAGRFRLPPTEFDEPEHKIWRKAVFDDLVNVKTPERIEGGVRADAEELVDGFAPTGHCDLVKDFADQVPLRAICRLIGIDISMGPEIRALTDQLLASLGDPKAAGEASNAMAEMVLRVIDERSSVPKEDFLSGVLNADMGGRPITREEVGQAVASLVAAGHATTAQGAANLLYEALKNPGLKERLVADPALIPLAVEESLRLHPVSMGFYRTATKKTEIAGTKIEPGEFVMMCWGTANRDPSRYEDPDLFKLERVRKRNLTFGLGRHVCIGAPMARMQLRIMLEVLLQRLPDIELIDPDSVEPEFGGIEFIELPSMPVKFEPRRRT